MTDEFLVSRDADDDDRSLIDTAGTVTNNGHDYQSLTGT